MAARKEHGLSRRDVRSFAVVGAIAVVALLLRLGTASPVLVFAGAGIAVGGLAWLLGIATEEAGEAIGPRASSLLNASFGNAPELIIVILAVRAGLVDVAKASIVGSVLGNLLLILGATLVFSGARYGRQSFDRRVAVSSAVALVFATVALGVPTLFHATQTPGANAEIWVSRLLAVLMLALYALCLYASFQEPEERGGAQHARWSIRTSVVVLSVTALATGVLSEILVAAIEPTIKETGVNRILIGLIIVPLVGNIAEHLAAVKVAWHGQLDFGMRIAFNSALQVALAGAAIAVVAGAVLGHDLTLVFTPLEIAFLVAATLGAGLIAVSGSATWIEGAQLLAIYVVAGLVFGFS